MNSIEIEARFETDIEVWLTIYYTAYYGECDSACSYVFPYGWVPECGCPVHD